jgi:D-amino-acid dehydrogenase
MLRNCTSGRYARNKGRMVPLAEYSRDRLRELRERTGIAYEERMQGTLQLFRTPGQLAGAADDIAVLQRFGVAHQMLDREGCLRYEPALAAVRGRFVGGLRLPGDETGDCHQFTTALAARAASAGVVFRYGTTIHGLVMEGARVRGALVGGERLAADLVLVCLASHAPALLKPLGIDLPVYPVKGYSITVPIVDETRAPESTVMDETHKVAITRLGDRIRVGGTAELAGYDLGLRPRREAALKHVLNDLFPGAGDAKRGTFWCGLRPMTPDGTPIVGPTWVPGLWLATGHGTLGWTMAAGTAALLVDLVDGRTPAVDPAPLSLDRYRSWMS